MQARMVDQVVSVCELWEGVQRERGNQIRVGNWGLEKGDEKRCFKLRTIEI